MTLGTMLLGVLVLILIRSGSHYFYGRFAKLRETARRGAPSRRRSG